MNQKTAKTSTQNVSVIPIEWFRWDKSQTYIGSLKPDFKNFRSSGTTSQNRSTSRFSEEGLDAYKRESLKGFTEFTREWLPPTTQIEIFSLVARTSDLPQSSLAQMIAWLGENYPLQYMDSVDLLESPSVGKDCPQRIVFATRADLQGLCYEARKLRKKLPRDFRIIETGGNKGMLPALSDKEFLAAMLEDLDVEAKRIASEYSMCELSAQAYAWRALQTNTTNELREELRFKFPENVKLFVADHLDALSDSGMGCLTILDPSRLDVAGAIRTQDYVRLETDGSFVFLERLIGSPLKGCSSTQRLWIQSKEKNEDALDLQVLEAKIKSFLNFITSDNAVRSLSLECGSYTSAKHCLDDFCFGIPQETETWLNLLGTANALNVKNKKILFISPESHSLAIIQPLLLAWLAGAKCAVRIPSPRLNLLTNLITRLNLIVDPVKVDPIETFNHRFVINEENSIDFKNLGFDFAFCFGTQHTLNSISSFIPVRGFSESLAVSFSATIQSATPKELVRDAFSLGQQGCVNSRLLYCAETPPQIELETWVQNVDREFGAYWNATLPHSIAIAQHHERLRLEHDIAKSCQTLEYKHTSNGVFVYWMNSDSIELNETWLSRVPFSLGIVYPTKSWPDFNLAPLAYQDIHTIYSNIAVTIGENQKVRLPGSAQRLGWSGMHQGEAWFDPTKLVARI